MSILKNATREVKPEENSHIKQTGVWTKPQKETNLGAAQAFFDC